jgi:hypothetical protein
VAQLCQQQGEFAQRNVEVLIITFGSGGLAWAWLAETCSSFHLLLDPSRRVYDLYGLERSLWRSWGLKTIWRYAQLLVAGRQWRGIQGDSAQLGGDFIVDSGGIVRLAYRSHDPTDRPSIEKLFSIFDQTVTGNS